MHIYAYVHIIHNKTRYNYYRQGKLIINNNIESNCVFRNGPIID